MNRTRSMSILLSPAPFMSNTIHMRFLGYTVRCRDMNRRENKTLRGSRHKKEEDESEEGRNYEKMITLTYLHLKGESNPSLKLECLFAVFFVLADVENDHIVAVLVKPMIRSHASPP